MWGTWEECLLRGRTIHVFTCPVGIHAEIHAWPASERWWWASVWSMLDTFGPPIPQAALRCGPLTSPLSFFQFEEFFSFSFFTFSLQAWLTLRPWACSLARGQMYSRHMGGRGNTALPALSRNSHGSRESLPTSALGSHPHLPSLDPFSGLARAMSPELLTLIAAQLSL